LHTTIGFKKQKSQGIMNPLRKSSKTLSFFCINIKTNGICVLECNVSACNFKKRKRKSITQAQKQPNVTKKT
jgi:hypothetical protein